MKTNTAVAVIEYTTQVSNDNDTNKTESYFAGSHRKIFTAHNIKNFIAAMGLAAAGGLVGLISGLLPERDNLQFNDTSVVTLKTKDYLDNIVDVSSTAAFVSGAVTAASIFVLLLCNADKKHAQHKSNVC